MLPMPGSFSIFSSLVRTRRLLLKEWFARVDARATPFAWSNGKFARAASMPPARTYPQLQAAAQPRPRRHSAGWPRAHHRTRRWQRGRAAVRPRPRPRRPSDGGRRRSCVGWQFARPFARQQSYSSALRNAAAAASRRGALLGHRLLLPPGLRIGARMTSGYGSTSRSSETPGVDAVEQRLRWIPPGRFDGLARR